MSSSGAQGKKRSRLACLSCPADVMNGVLRSFPFNSSETCGPAALKILFRRTAELEHITRTSDYRNKVKRLLHLISFSKNFTCCVAKSPLEIFIGPELTFDAIG